MLKVALLSCMLILSGCVSTGFATSSMFSKQADELKAHTEAYKFDFKKNEITKFKLPEKQKIDGINKQSIARLDSERRDLRDIVEKLELSVSKKDKTIEQLIRVIKLLEIERDINSNIAQKALKQLDKAETKNTINDLFGKGMSIVSVLALLGIL